MVCSLLLLSHFRPLETRNKMTTTIIRNADMHDLSANGYPSGSGGSGEDDDLKSTSSGHNAGHWSKFGRAGDPRMHKAVAARMEHPNLPLVEALRIGGFKYPEDCRDDSTCLDCDNITLGQRKNQLSRRCRLAKQHEEKNGGGPKPTSLATLTNAEARAELQKTMQVSSELKKSWSSDTRGFKRLSSELNIPDDDVANVMDTQEELSTMRHRMAKFHPQYHQILVPQSHSSADTAAVAASYGSAKAAPRSAWPRNPGQFTAQPLLNAQPLFQALNNVRPAHHPSGVAIASLNATAASVGLTLEQLAVSLSSTTNLAKVLADQSIPEMKQDLALSLYQAEVSTLYQRCMLLAGFRPEEVQDTSLAYKQFALKAWSAEGERLTQEIGRSSTPDSPSAPAPVGLQDEKATDLQDAHSHSNGHEHAHVHQGSNGDQNSINEKACFDGRHVHRLEGKCGHKAIIHQPDGAPAHVDFVVNGKVECYEGIKPVGTNAALWPSRYNCEELSCQTGSHKVACECENECESIGKPDPKIFPLSDIDLDGNEWNADFFENSGTNDYSLLGLMGLSGSEDARQSTIRRNSATSSNDRMGNFSS
jgi:hypothetical protein